MTPKTETSRRADGWRNRCSQCGQFYWIRNADQTATKATRWTDDTLTERHRCEVPNYQGERAQLNLEFRNEVQAVAARLRSPHGAAHHIGEALEYLAWRGMAVVK